MRNHPKSAPHRALFWLMALVASLGLLLPSGPAMAGEPSYIRKSVRALGMGNAFLAVADDDDALFYNPAGLQQIKHGNFKLAAVQITANQHVVDMSNAQEGAATDAIIGEAVGSKFYMDMGVKAVSYAAPGWGYALYANTEVDIGVHNPIVPNFDLTSYAQQVAVIGWSSNTLDHSLYWGFTVKRIKRVGLERQFYMTDFLDDAYMQQLQDDIDAQTQEGGLQRSSGDFGVIYNLNDSFDHRMKLAVVARNIGGMDFDLAGQIPSTVDMGFASESELFGGDLILAADLVDVTGNQDDGFDFMRNLNLGAELGILPLWNNRFALSFRVGLKGTYPSYGFSFTIPYFMTVDYAIWSQEVGTGFGSIRDQRQSMEVSLLDF